MPAFRDVLRTALSWFVLQPAANEDGVVTLACMECMVHAIEA